MPIFEQAIKDKRKYFYADKGEDYHKNCRNWQMCVSETSPYRVEIDL
jgi:hypothetical protein